MSAVRLARGATGRDRVVKFDGCYHGHSDGLLAGGGSGVAMLGLPGSVGVPLGAVAATAVVPYNVIPELTDEVACVIVEPVAANMNLVAPRPGFLAGLRAACDAVGALLIFDEVITGFRLGSGGATAWSGVTPDLWCFGKVIGGGLPVGAFGGRRELLAELAPGGPVYQAGTLSGNPLATAAGLAVLSRVTDGDYADLTARVAAFASRLSSAIAGGGLDVVAPAIGPLVGLFLADRDGPGTAETERAAPIDYVSAGDWCRGDLYPQFFHAMLRRGIALAPGPYEVMFPGLAHGDDVLTRVVEAAGDAAAEVAKRRFVSP
jgi:glutamate-1-semialdehyde 2,1-aminomutase